MLSETNHVIFEETADRLKITLPVKRNWLFFLIFSLLLLFWVAGLVWGVVFTINDVAFSGERYAFVFTIILLIWLYIWFRLGKIIWRLWQHQAANREILFIDKERLIIRRPVSILGITDAYDREYISPFLFSKKHESPGFDYGNQRVYFGEDLEQKTANDLVRFLNKRYFNYVDDDY